MRLYSSTVEEKLRTMPDDPGVYLMKNEKNTIIYVGKAKVLKNRVRQYFGVGAQKNSKTAAMVEQIYDFDYIITNSEKEALILECNLIKQYQPHYNILLKDGKHYPYAKIDLSKDFPIIEIVRKVEKDRAKYFGPYYEAYTIKETLDAIYKLFPLRNCTKEIDIYDKPERPCLNYQMGRCKAPCAKKIAKSDYRKIVDDVIDVLSGKYQQIEKKLKEEMLSLSEKMEYEKAAQVRDKLYLLDKIKQKQNAGFPDLNDRDIIASTIGQKFSAVQIFCVRKGKISEAKRYFLENVTGIEEVNEAFIQQYYSEASYIPNRIYVNALNDENGVLQEWLTDIAGKKISLGVPKKGEFKTLTLMAEKNAREALIRKEDRDIKKVERTKGAAERLGEILGIGYVKRMECYDISNIQGTNTVSSMVVFTDGKPDKKEYRRFRIKTVEGANDFASMAETLQRRILEGFNAEDKEHGFGAMPDLIVIDGGKGQLHSVMETLESLGMDDINVVGLAKRIEEIFVPGREGSIILEKSSPELGLITHIRDEAHRFAITYHRNLREKRIISSELDVIKGIGPKRKNSLLGYFGSIDKIKTASIDELLEADGMNVTSAREIYRYFHQDAENLK